MTIQEWLGNEELPITIWENKYRHEGESLDEWFERVSGSNQEVAELIKDKKFIFGGRILANRGIKDRRLTYSNCYVCSPPEDNIESIFEAGSKIARTFSYGGGIGVDISNLRPRGAMVNNAAKTTTGAVSFMDFYSHITGLIGQEGRRGALMISIDCNHPDLLDFINLKTDLNICTKANISIRFTNEFMNAVSANKDYCLRWPCDTKLPEGWQEYEYDQLYSYKVGDKTCYAKKVKAKDLFMLIAQRNWEMGEPGVLFWDTISSYNLLQDTYFEYKGVNPCAV